MGRMNRVLSATGFVVIATAAVPSSVLAQQGAVPELRTVSALVGGAINGVVSDDRGGPVPGAMVPRPPGTFPGRGPGSMRNGDWLGNAGSSPSGRFVG